MKKKSSKSLLSMEEITERAKKALKQFTIETITKNINDAAIWDKRRNKSYNLLLTFFN